MLTNLHYILITALRDWLFAAIVAGLVTCALIAGFLGNTALIENTEMTLSYTSATVRIIIITGIILFSCFHVRNAFETREIEVFLSRPLTRASLVFSYWLGLAVLSFLLVIPAIALVAVQGVISWQGFMLWSGSLILESWLMVSVSLLFAFISRSAVVSVTASTGLYVLARLTGFFVAISGQSHLLHVIWLDNGMAAVVKILSVMMPRLDCLVRSDWLIYGIRHTGEPGLAMFIQAALFIPVLLLATIVYFKRRAF